MIAKRRAKDPIVYGHPSNMGDPFWLTHRMGGCVVPSVLTWRAGPGGRPVLTVTVKPEPEPEADR